MKTILQYLKGLRDQSIIYDSQDELLIEGYLDLDRAGNKKCRKLMSGFISMLNKGSVSWYSKKQPTIALSSIEAEYITLTMAAQSTIWLQIPLTKLGLF